MKHNLVISWIFGLCWLCVSGSMAPLSKEAQSAKASGGWDGCGIIPCEAINDPVCGSDGKTYNSECLLQRAVCENAELTMVAKGPCAEQVLGGAPQVDVPQGAAPRTLPQSECQLICTLDYTPVCGSDGKTYGNLCSLESTACTQKNGVIVAHQGECAAEPALNSAAEAGTGACNKACPRMYTPVCGSDGKTYNNLCLLQLEKCQQKSDLTMTHQGECGKAQPQQVSAADESPKCNNRCPKMYKPVCGSNGKTYSNFCLMELEKCQTGSVELSKARNGEC